MPTSDLTAEEMFDSLTGFDEIAVSKTFGRTVLDLSREDEMAFARSLAFVHFRREGQDDKTAKTSALTLTIGALKTFFVPEQEEGDLGPDGLGKAEEDPTEPTPET